MAVTPTIADRLAARTRELVDIPSVSRNEERIARYVRDAMPAGPLEILYSDAAGETLLYAHGDRGTRPLIVLAGHLDSVPAQDNLPARIESGAVHGLGAADMKGGLAVMIELARWLADAGAALELEPGLLFFPREELSQEESALPALFAAEPTIFEADLVVVLEPTDNTIQVGCMGNLNAQLVYHGESAHSARPWLGVNAVDLAVEALHGVFPIEPCEQVVAGLPFVEVVSITQIRGGLATNVIPDRVECVVNFRYAPERTPEEAEARLRELIDGAGDPRILSNSPPARVAADAPLVRRLQEAGGFSIEPKQAWTPVAEFAAHGLDAVNLGPGATRFAHRRDEQVEIGELVRTFDAIARFLT